MGASAVDAELVLRSAGDRVGGMPLRPVLLVHAFPHLEEDDGANEAELDGARE